MRQFEDLNTREVLALAMEIERNNAERLQSLAELYKYERVEIAKYFATLGEEELDHLKTLNDYWAEQFGDEQPPAVGEMEVAGVIEAVEVDHGEHLIFDDFNIEDALKAVKDSEVKAERFYLAATDATNDKMLRELYQQLADLEATHNAAIDRMEVTK